MNDFFYRINLDTAASVTAGWSAPLGGESSTPRKGVGEPSVVVRTPIKGGTLVVELQATAAIERTPYCLEIQEAYIIDEDGEEFAPPDLIGRIKIEGYARLGLGLYRKA